MTSSTVDATAECTPVQTEGSDALRAEIAAAVRGPLVIALIVAVSFLVLSHIFLAIFMVGSVTLAGAAFGVARRPGCYPALSRMASHVVARAAGNKR